MPAALLIPWPSVASRGAERTKGAQKALARSFDEHGGLTRRPCDRCRTQFLPEFLVRETAGAVEREFCKKCHDYLAREWNRAAPKREQHYRRIYGLSLESHAGLYLAQGGRCAICRDLSVTAQDLVVDHDHDDGAVRGLLCDRCNTGLGHFADDPIRLTAAIAYLLEARKRQDDLDALELIRRERRKERAEP